MMNDTLKNLLKPLTSLRLTVVLLAMGIVLVFCGTWAQRYADIWQVMGSYFRCWLTWVPLRIFLPRDTQVRFVFPFPGGYTLAVLLCSNLIAAHSVRFKWTWKRSGIHLIHGSMLLLIISEAVTALQALETQMPIYVGQTINWSHDIRQVELAVIDHSGSEYDHVAAVDQSHLAQAASTGRPIRDSQLPFDIKVLQFMDNSRLLELPDNGSIKPQGTAGFAVTHAVHQVASATGVSESSVNMPAVIVTLTKDGRELGRYILTPQLQSQLYRFLGQKVTVDGRSYDIYLRFRRYYKPYTVSLTKFTHDVYPGTNIPRDFASDVHLVDPSRHEDRQVRIYMNNPLRYAGETFFQSGWIPSEEGGADLGTVLQVVDNPGWTIPYIACTLGTLGLIIHFTMHLIRFIRKSSPA